MLAILQDMAAGRYTDIDLSAFLTACTAVGMSLDEVAWLTRGMVQVGERVAWDHAVVADKHSVGGLPGNRTSPIVVSIVAAGGVCIPKTSSRAITSPAGTADAMETLAPVDLDLASMRRGVEREGGCVIWGGAIHLSPVDDLLIRVERALDLDSEAQLVASVLSKKVAAGSSHVVIDIPVGPTAKIRTLDAAQTIAHLLERALCTNARPEASQGTMRYFLGRSLHRRDPRRVNSRVAWISLLTVVVAIAVSIGDGIANRAASFFGHIGGRLGAFLYRVTGRVESLLDVMSEIQIVIPGCRRLAHADLIVHLANTLDRSRQAHRALLRGHCRDLAFERHDVVLSGHIDLIRCDQVVAGELRLDRGRSPQVCLSARRRRERKQRRGQHSSQSFHRDSSC